MKRFIAILLILPLLLASVSVFAIAAAIGFTDVAATSWYYKSVQYAADNGIASGRGNGIFDPEGTLSVAEAVKLVCGVYAQKNAAESPEQSDSLWYDAYFDYAIEHGIMAERPKNPDALINRAFFAQLIDAAASDLIVRNSIVDGDIRDVAVSSDYSDAVYSLYRAGVLTGSDVYGRFYPERTLTRAEACEIIMRVLVLATRRSVNLTGELDSRDIFELCGTAVFSIETFDANGESIRTGSGFFISSDGLAATNLHVLEKAHSARITTNGIVYDILGVAAYSAEGNTAIIQVDGTGFEWLPITSSDDAKVGQEVYSIGNPLGLDGTISKGIISFVGRETGGRVFLQFTASISQGSGGGALVNSRGYVIGITSNSYTAGSSLNLAIPSKNIMALTPGALTALAEVVHADNYTG